MDKKSMLIIFLIILLILVSIYFFTFFGMVEENNILEQKKLSHVTIRNSEVIKFSSLLEGISQNPNSSEEYSFEKCGGIDLATIGEGGITLLENCSFDEEYVFGITENEKNEKLCKTVCGLSVQNCSMIKYFSLKLSHPISNICLNLKKESIFSNDPSICGIEENYTLIENIQELHFEDFLIKNVSNDSEKPIICLYNKK